MPDNLVFCDFFFKTKAENRAVLFEKAFERSKFGKVLYILQEELTELPKMSEDFSSIDRNYIKMLTFLYLPNMDSMIDGISTLPNWQNIPSTIILDDLGEYCNKNKFQNACGIVALLLDTAYSCSKVLKSECKLYISCTKETFGEEHCKVLRELYSK